MKSLEESVPPHVSVVIPVYEAQDCLDELYRRLTVTLGRVTDSYEIILVEDCSGDGSWKKICDLAETDSRVIGLQFSRNFGQHYGITAGLDFSQGEWVVVMDCDLQDRPEAITRLYEKAQEGYDVVLAKRFERKDSWLKRSGSRVFYRILSYLADIEYDGNQGNFRIVSRKVVDNLCAMREQLRFFGGLVHWMGFPTSTIEVEHSERYLGASSYTFSKLWKLAIETIIAYSDKPLRIAVRLGFSMSILSLCFGIYILIRALLYESSAVGWSSLMVSLYFIGGIIIAILGVIGVYLGKTFDESKKRPLYIISKITSNHGE